jgi:hypothetical protein
LKHPCSSARSGSRRNNGVARQKAEFHQPSRYIVWQVNAIENAFFAAAQIGHRRRPPWSSRISRPSLENHLQLIFSIRPHFESVKKRGVKAGGILLG